MKLLMLPGDGIGPEIMVQVRHVLDTLQSQFGLSVEVEQGLLGGCAYESCGKPLPEDTVKLAQQADAVLLGAVGGPQWDQLPRHQRPESGLLGIRSALGLFANLRPALVSPSLVGASSLRPDYVSGLDLLIVRELTGGIYFGQPRGETTLDGEAAAFNTMIYKTSEIRRIVDLACRLASQRQGRVCSVDKANVLEVSGLWRQVADQVAMDHPNISMSHMYVDNAAMQLVRQPKQFDVMVTGNLFGDILSDCAAMLTGSIGMLPSASLDKEGKGLYEPVHGSAPDIAGQGQANPLAAILSLAMLLRFSAQQPQLADFIEQAVEQVLTQGLRTRDIAGKNQAVVSTQQMGQGVVQALQNFAN